MGPPREYRQGAAPSMRAGQVLDPSFPAATARSRFAPHGHQAERVTAVGQGSAEYFTGTVRIDPLFEAPDPARARGAVVTFEPCARTAWHTHPLGQTLIVTSGCGLTQVWGG